MGRGQIFSFEALLSLLIVLFFTFFTVDLYYNFPRDDLRYEDYKLSLNYALLKMDERGFLNEIALRNSWGTLYNVLMDFLPNCEIRLEVYNQELSKIFSKGYCSRVFRVVCYIFVADESSTFYGIKVYIG